MAEAVMNARWILFFIIATGSLSATGLAQEDFDLLKHALQEQSPRIFALKQTRLVSEGPRGFLTSSEQLDLGQRELVQRENYLREKMFALIAGRTGSTVEAVAGKFAELARRTGTPMMLESPQTR